MIFLGSDFRIRVPYVLCSMFSGLEEKTNPYFKIKKTDSSEGYWKVRPPILKYYSEFVDQLDIDLV